jgi:hypothetical protein
MPEIGRAEVAAVLAHHDPAALRAVLDAAGVRAFGASTPEALAARIADALWWHATSPIGLALRAPDLDRIVDQVAERMGVLSALPIGDAWERARALTAALVTLADGRSGVSLDDLSAGHRQRLGRSWLPRLGLATGSAGSLGTAWAGKAVLRWTAGPIGRLIPYLPTVGPWFVAARKGAGLAAALGGPAGVGLGLLALNDALGPDYRALVPLLLGVGALAPAGAEAATELPQPR